MKKSIGLITIHGVLNYGSLLQTFATSFTLKKIGHDCTVIDYKYPTEYQLKNAPHFKVREKVSKELLFFKVIRKILTYYLGISQKEKRNKFEAFKLKYLKFTRSYDSFQDIKVIPPDFDIYITGSDQVWNPTYCHDDTTFLLDFVSKDKKKISFASSFGANDIIKDYKATYAELLKKYESITVREYSGIEIVKELTGKDAQWLLDPTFLLTATEWSNYAKSIKKHSKPYILCYLLAYSFNPFPFAYNFVEYIRKLTGYDVIYIGGDPLNALKSGTKIFTNVGPEEFIALFRDASFVITSSFHGTAFATNFSKPFYTITSNQNSHDDRQLSLMEKLGLQERMIQIGRKFPDKKDLELDFSEVKRILMLERQKSIDYLTNQTC